MSKDNTAIYATEDERSGETLDRFLFFVVLIAGIAGILLMKYYGVNQIYVTACPVTLMLIYFFYMNYSSRFLLRDDRAADNLYYLGFLFTLVSMMYSLYEFSNFENAAERIITNFGIALATTMTGLALRVIHLQMRQDPAEIERLTRKELSDAAYEFRDQMQTSILEMKDFRTSIEQQFSEAIEEITEKFKLSLINTVDEFTESAEKIVGVLNISFNKFVSNTERLERNTSRIVDGVETLSQKLTQIDIPSDIVHSKFEDIVGDLSSAVSSVMVRTGDILDEHSKLSKVLEILKSNAIDTQEALSRILSQISPLENVNRNIVKFSESTVRLNERLELQTKIVDDLIEPLENLMTTAVGAENIKIQLSGASNHIENISTSFDNVRNNVDIIKDNLDAIIQQDEHFKTLSKSLESVQERFTNLDVTVKKYNNNIKKWIYDIKKDSDLVKVYRTNFENEIAKSNALVRDMHSALNSLAQVIINNLNEK